ncbi:MAG: MerR family transcriptional regulator [Serpentinimonas sp.]|nr:MerR family transcriptional regulator [Serpentinimonas sp.]
MLKRTSPTPAALALSIADVERDTGLGKDTLRVWERRYGFPTPGRDAHGERRYDESQLQRLRLIKRLLDAGQRPHQVVPLPEAELQARIQTVLQQQVPPDPQAPALDIALRQQWLDALQANQTEALRQQLQGHLLRHGLGPTIEDCIVPLSVAVGQAWLNEQISVFQEHLHSEIVQSVLRQALAQLDQQSHQTHPPRVLLTTLPNENHSLGLLMAECFLALQGCQRYPLGPNTPVPEVLAAAQQLQIDAVALSFSATQPSNEVLAALRQLRDQLPPAVALWVGGNAPVLRSRRLPTGVSAVRRACELEGLVAQWRMGHAAPVP